MRSSSYIRQKTSATAFDRPSSIVKRSCDQSQEQPRDRSWWTIVPPYCLRHSQTRSMNASRPRSWRRLPSLRRAFSTTFCVAMPAWSVPGTHSTSRPCMRRQRVRTSWIVSFRAWPMWRMPVTFGGGMTMLHGSPSPFGLNLPVFSHHGYHLASSAAGS